MVIEDERLSAQPRDAFATNEVERYNPEESASSTHDAIAPLPSRIQFGISVNLAYLRLVFLFFVLVLSLGVALDTSELNAQDEKAKSREAVVSKLQSLYEPRQFAASNQIVLNYRLLKPVGYVPGKKYPLILFLHGAGERGGDNRAPLIHAAKDFADTTRREKFPCYVVIPQCPSDKKWSDVDWSQPSSALPEQPSQPMQAVKELLDEMIQNAGIDSNRVYITGLSMGGYGTWDAIARYPNYFAAAVPICGGGDPKTVKLFARTPVWCFHGDADSVVSVKRSREMVDAMKSIGIAIKYTEYPDVQHDSWTTTYANPDLYAWLFAQQRASE